jgi:hypothetical protein
MQPYFNLLCKDIGPQKYVSPFRNTFSDFIYNYYLIWNRSVQQHIKKMLFKILVMSAPHEAIGKLPGEVPGSGRLGLWTASSQTALHSWLNNNIALGRPNKGTLLKKIVLVYSKLNFTVHIQSSAVDRTLYLESKKYNVHPKPPQSNLYTKKAINLL